MLMLMDVSNIHLLVAWPVHLYSYIICLVQASLSSFNIACRQLLIPSRKYSKKNSQTLYFLFPHLYDFFSSRRTKEVAQQYFRELKIELFRTQQACYLEKANLLSPKQLNFSDSWVRFFKFKVTLWGMMSMLDCIHAPAFHETCTHFVPQVDSSGQHVGSQGEYGHCSRSCPVHDDRQTAPLTSGSNRELRGQEKKRALKETGFIFFLFKHTRRLQMFTVRRWQELLRKIGPRKYCRLI